MHDFSTPSCCPTGATWSWCLSRPPPPTPDTAHARMDVTPVKESRTHPPSDSTDSGYDSVDASY